MIAALSPCMIVAPASVPAARSAGAHVLRARGASVNLWQTLDTSRAALGGPLAAEAAILADTFAALDDGIGELSAIASELASVTSVLGVKGRNLALACYTLILSGLAQESGALLRPLVETIEQITYVRLDEQRLDEVRNGTLPTAGLIAQAIDSPHHKLRTYLNKNASHIGEGEYTFRHPSRRTARCS